MKDERRKQMADAKATSSAVDFLAAIAGKTERFEVEGITVELRSLAYDEAETLMAQYGDKPLELGFHVLPLGIASPQLSEKEWAQVRQSRPGPLSKISNRIMVLSGMAAEDSESKSPLAGTGSSTDT